MFHDTHFPPHDMRLAALLRADRRSIGRAIETFIAELDARDGDPDQEDGDEDCCLAGDDAVRTGTGPLNAGHLVHLDHVTIGSEDDAEDDRPPCYAMDQRQPLFVVAANDWPMRA